MPWYRYIEDCICRKDPLAKVLRLICLQSITNGGLKPKVFEFYRRELLQTYGFEHALTLVQLEEAGLFKVQVGSSVVLTANRTHQTYIRHGGPRFETLRL